MIEWAPATLDYFSVGRDGKTAYEKLKGKPFTKPMVEFGESVQFKVQTRKGQKRGKMKSRWGIGIFLGLTRRAHEYMVGTPFGAHKCRTIQRMAPSNRWNLERFNHMRGRHGDGKLKKRQK